MTDHAYEFNQGCTPPDPDALEALAMRCNDAAATLTDAFLWCDKSRDVRDAAEAVLDVLGQGTLVALEKACEGYRKKLGERAG